MAIAREGYVFVAAASTLALAGFVIAAVSGSWIVWLASYLAVVLALAFAFFFRDPERVGERGAHLILAPADGRIVQIAEVQEPAYIGGPATRVSIFLSLFDVHVQRAPAAGVVEYRDYKPGRFLAAWQERASLENEQSSIGINTGEHKLLVRQIAGLVAQRIVTYVEEGARVEQGERIGLIRFGSRVDTFLPPGAELRVKAGDRASAGQTVLAELPRGTP
jgi:phosphatidylserine decarboxylase